MAWRKRRWRSWPVATGASALGKAHQLKAAFELGRRSIVALPPERLRIKSPADAANLLLADMGALEQEELRTIIVDTKNQVLKIHTVYVGSLNTAVVRIAEVFREAIRLNAAAIIALHNHPSRGSQSLARRRSRHPPARRSRQAAEHRRPRSSRDRTGRALAVPQGAGLGFLSLYTSNATPEWSTPQENTTWKTSPTPSASVSSRPGTAQTSSAACLRARWPSHHGITGISRRLSLTSSGSVRPCGETASVGYVKPIQRLAEAPFRRHPRRPLRQQRAVAAGQVPGGAGRPGYGGVACAPCRANRTTPSGRERPDMAH